MGTSRRHPGEDGMTIGVSAFTNGWDEAREGKRGVVADSGSSLNTLVNSSGKSSQFGEQGERLVGRIRRSVRPC